MLQMQQWQHVSGIPCFRCKMPELLPENFLAWRVFSIASSQMRVVGMGSPLGIEFDAIDRAMELVGVPPDDRDRCFEAVREAGVAYAKLVRDRQEAERQKIEAQQKRRPVTRSGFEFPPNILWKPKSRG